MGKIDYAWLMISRSSKITFMSRQRYKSKPKVNDHYAIFIRKRKGKKSASTRMKTFIKGHFHNQSSKLVASKGKEVNMAAGNSDDALVCCVENTVEDPIIDSCASFHATYFKEELERFKLCSGKFRLADDMTLDIAGIEDVVLKTYFGISWTLTNVRYIPCLKRRLILVGQLDKEGYHIGFKDKQWKVTKGSLVVAHRDKRRSLYMVEDWYEHVSFQRQHSRCIEARWFEEAEEAFLHNVREDKKNAEFGVAERLSRTFRAESTRLRVEAPKMLWADSVSTTHLIYHIPYVLIGLHIPEEEWRWKDTSLAHLKAAAQMKYDTAFGIRRVTGLSKAEILHLWTRFMEPVTKYGLSSKITQSPGGSSITSEGSVNSRSFKDSGRSDEEYSEDGASSKEGGSETPHVRRSTREFRAPVRYSPSVNYLLLSEYGKLESYSEALSSKESVQRKKTIIKEMGSLKKNQTCSLVKISTGKKAS
nr:retrovirus-related Pol polyprotein from transposon TNT 1-94 [Tanacetum cinerariifolium]